MKNIIFAGIDGSGKSSCVKWFYSYLQSKNISASCHIGKGDLQNKELLHLLNNHSLEGSRVEYIATILDLAKKLLAVSSCPENVVNIWDRYYICLLAYYHALGIYDPEFERIFDFVPKGDVYIFLDVKPEVALNRIFSRGAAKEAEKDSVYQNKVREQYIHLLKDQNTIYIDANQDFEHVKEDLLRNVKGLF